MGTGASVSAADWRYILIVLSGFAATCRLARLNSVRTRLYVHF